MRWLALEEPNLAKVGQLTARVVDSARVASEIVQRIRAMASQASTEHVAVDLGEVIEEALIFVRHEIETRSIELSVAAEECLPHVLGDRVQLQQVIVNLVLNAVQAIGQGGISQGRIGIHAAEKAEGIVVSIHDDGPGIAAEDLDRIFGSFFSTKTNGIGIGLAICRSIIASHGGAITGTNRATGGAMFRFVLPVTRDAEPTLP